MAGEEGEELWALCRSPTRAPVALGLRPGCALLGWVRGTLGAALVQAPGTWRPDSCGCRRNHGGCLEPASSLLLCLQYGDLPLNYIFILSAILAAYMICKRLPGNCRGSPGVLFAEASRMPGDWDLAALVSFLCHCLPPVASQSCLSHLSPPRAAASCLLGNQAELDN